MMMMMSKHNHVRLCLHFGKVTGFSKI